MVAEETGVHLPNVFNISLSYRCIKNEFDEVQAESEELIEKICESTKFVIGQFVYNNFKRFSELEKAI